MKSFNDYIIHKARDEPEKVVKARFNVQKSYAEQRLVFGWANVSARADGEKITDWQEDIIDIDELDEIDSHQQTYLFELINYLLNMYILDLILQR